MNPRTAINGLHPFQGCPFSLLGTSPYGEASTAVFWTAELLTRYEIIQLLPFVSWRLTETENVGFEPTVPFGITGFQDRRLKPLGQLSKEREY